MIDFDRFSYLTFDCYGTLIDWETGILEAVRPVLAQHGIAQDDAEIIRLYAQAEAELEAGPYRRYRSVLRGVMARMADELGFQASDAEQEALASSPENWRPFADSVAALGRLGKRYKLVILSNIDDDLFAATQRLLPARFDAVFTAQQIGSYKPSPANFHYALDQLGVNKEQVLHVAQILYHDHAPAKKLGFSTAWVNRASVLPGTDVSLPVDVEPDVEAPDLRSLADLMGL